jgi:hypothetical protein
MELFFSQTTLTYAHEHSKPAWQHTHTPPKLIVWIGVVYPSGLGEEYL